MQFKRNLYSLKFCKYHEIFLELLCKLTVLQDNPEIKEIRCNTPLDGSELGEYTTDFLCVKSDNDLMVRECVYRKLLPKPKTAKLLDASRVYWLKRGVTDWGLVVDAEK